MVVILCIIIMHTTLNFMTLNYFYSFLIGFTILCNISGSISKLILLTKVYDFCKYFDHTFLGHMASLACMHNN